MTTGFFEDSPCPLDGSFHGRIRDQGAPLPCLSGMSDTLAEWVRPDGCGAMPMAATMRLTARHPRAGDDLLLRDISGRGKGVVGGAPARLLRPSDGGDAHQCGIRCRCASGRRGRVRPAWTRSGDLTPWSLNAATQSSSDHWSQHDGYPMPWSEMPSRSVDVCVVLLAGCGFLVQNPFGD